MSDCLLTTIEGRVAILTLNRPDSLNALTPDLMRALVDGVRAVGKDDAIGCVVLTGAGRGFCAGGDVKAIARSVEDRVAEVSTTTSSPEDRARWLRRNADVSRLLHEMPKPVIAMINGACAGAGLSIAAACDLRYAAASAKFAPAFTANGMPGDYGGAWLWTQILGAAKARELYLVDRKRTAAEARAFGLVHEVHADDELGEVVMALARRLAALPPAGLALAKANLNAALTDTLADALDRDSLAMMLARQALIDARKAQA